MHLPHDDTRAFSRRAHRALVRILLMAFLITGAACDEFGTGPGEDAEDDVNGTWVGTINTLTVYVQITNSTITVYDGRESACFNMTQLTILSRDGETFTLERDGVSGSFTATIRLEGQQLVAAGLRPVRDQITYSSSSQDPSAFDTCVITGQWGYEESAFSEYLVLTATSLSRSLVEAGCAELQYYTLENIGPDTYTMTSRNFGTTQTVTIRNEGGIIAIGFSDGFVISYERNQTDLSNLDYCGGGDDPGVTCSALPTVSVGGSVAGELTSSDPVDADRGKYYDLYGLTLGSQQSVTISLTAQDENVLDTWLIVWDADGNMYAVNDDANETTFNSALTLDLPAGCWRIEATSWSGGETGQYTLAVD